jgi:hypothetical protein
MFGPHGEKMDFGNGNGHVKIKLSKIVPGHFNGQPKKPSRFVNGVPVFDDGTINEGGTISTASKRRNRHRSHKRACAIADASHM